MSDKQSKIDVQDLLQMEVMNYLEVQDMLISDMLLEKGQDLSPQRSENWQRLLKTIKQSAALHKAQRSLIHDLNYQLAQLEKSELQRQQAMIELSRLNKIVENLKQEIII